VPVSSNAPAQLPLMVSWPQTVVFAPSWWHLTSYSWFPVPLEVWQMVPVAASMRKRCGRPSVLRPEAVTMLGLPADAGEGADPDRPQRGAVGDGQPGDRVPATAAGDGADDDAGGDGPGAVAGALPYGLLGGEVHGDGLGVFAVADAQDEDVGGRANDGGTQFVGLLRPRR
jgi:hypothetical protein